MKILIIKLGAKGDVIRTLPILSALKEKYPESEITWVVKKENSELLKHHPLITKISFIPLSTEETFDLLYNFDIDKEATTLASKINAVKKYGFCCEKDSEYVSCFNLPAEYYLNTLFDDKLKKENKKTYQEMMFQAAEMPYKKQHYPLFLNEEDKKYAEEFIQENNLDSKKLIGIHLGASRRWPSKSWHKSHVVDFIKKVKERGYEVLLFGGPNEKQAQKEILSELMEKKINILTNHPENTDRQFASLVNICKIMLCSDSFALHISLALKKPTIALFFCTSPDEVEGYDLLKKIVSPELYNFFPEKMDQYSEKLVKSISVEEVLKALESFEDNGTN